MTIYQIQCLLGYLGYDPGAIDGIYGQQTKQEIKEFQQDYGLVPDGDAGPLTQKMMLGVIAGTVARKTSDNTTETSDNDVPENNVWNMTGTFWDSIKHFRREEFRCKCGGQFCNGYPAEMCETVVRIADAARDNFNRPAHVISGLRCPQWNAHESGVENSQHCSGEAIDLYIEGVPAETLRRFVSTQPGHRYSYNINGNNVHFDVPRGSK